MSVSKRRSGKYERSVYKAFYRQKYYIKTLGTDLSHTVFSYDFLIPTGLFCYKQVSWSDLE